MATSTAPGDRDEPSSYDQYDDDDSATVSTASTAAGAAAAEAGGFIGDIVDETGGGEKDEKMDNAFEWESLNSQQLRARAMALLEPSSSAPPTTRSSAPSSYAEPPKWRFVNTAKKSYGYSSTAAGQTVKGISAEELGAKYVAPADYEAARADAAPINVHVDRDDDEGEGNKEVKQQVHVHQCEDEGGEDSKELKQVGKLEIPAFLEVTEEEYEVVHKPRMKTSSLVPGSAAAVDALATTTTDDAPQLQSIPPNTPPPPQDQTPTHIDLNSTTSSVSESELLQLQSLKQEVEQTKRLVEILEAKDTKRQLQKEIDELEGERKAAEAKAAEAKAAAAVAAAEASAAASAATTADTKTAQLLPTQATTTTTEHEDHDDAEVIPPPCWKQKPAKLLMAVMCLVFVAVAVVVGILFSSSDNGESEANKQVRAPSSVLFPSTPVPSLGTGSNEPTMAPLRPPLLEEETLTRPALPDPTPSPADDNKPTISMIPSSFSFPSSTPSFQVPSTIAPTLPFPTFSPTAPVPMPTFFPTFGGPTRQPSTKPTVDDSPKTTNPTTLPPTTERPSSSKVADDDSSPTSEQVMPETANPTTLTILSPKQTARPTSPTTSPTEKPTCDENYGDFNMCIAIDMSGSVCNYGTGMECVACEPTYICQDFEMDKATCCNNFFDVVEFAKNMITSLESMSNTVQSYSVVGYGTNATTAMETMTPPPQTLEILDELVYTGGRTNHADAINACRASIASSPLDDPDKTNIMLLITDGEPSEPQGSPQADAEYAAAGAKDDGIFIIPVMIVPQFTVYEPSMYLQGISSDGVVFDVDDFAVLDSLRDNLLAQVSCQV